MPGPRHERGVLRAEAGSPGDQRLGNVRRACGEEGVWRRRWRRGSRSRRMCRRRSRWSRALAIRHRGCGRRRAGLINSIGLPNKGARRLYSRGSAAAHGDPRRCRRGCSDASHVAAGVPLITNVMGSSAEEFAALSAAARSAGIAAVELNVSCPNVKTGLDIGADPASWRRSCARAVRRRASR